MKRIAVDIGGTFTDLVYIDDNTQRIIVEKTRSTPQDIGQAVIDVIQKAKIELPEIVLFIHGTTAGLNTIAQRKGSKTGLLTTEGFIDVMEMTARRKEPYNYLWKKPEPLVPRYLRRGVKERTSNTGEVMEEPDADQVKEIIREMRDDGVEAIAVCFLHSYTNPENERKVEKIIHETWPEATVSISHQVAREIREFERTNTTVISAYMAKAVIGYLDRLEINLKDRGFKGQLLVLGPNGLLGLEALKENLLYTLASGTVGGAAGAARLAGLCGVKDVVTMDVGGTSFDVSVIKDGRSIEKHKSEVMGLPLLMSGIEVDSIGAGGGSIARVDAAGLLTVGPESAGASPGPMAYGMGGGEPTVTDAALVNGLIDPDYFLGGEIRLNLSLAQKGIETIAGRLGLSLHEAADGILAVARNNMTLAMQEKLIGQGYDPRDFVIMAFGGGGGIFAGNIAKDLAISRIIVPPEPGVFCARGILTMNLVHTRAQAYARTFENLSAEELTDIYRGMEEWAHSVLRDEGMTGDSIEYIRSLDVGYAGQRHYLETPVPGGELKDNAKNVISESFESLHERRYGHRIKSALITINARLKAVGKIKETALPEIKQGLEIPREAIKPARSVYLEGGFRETRVYERGGLLCGNTIKGPDRKSVV